MARKTLCITLHFPFIAPPAALLATGTDHQMAPSAVGHWLRFSSTTNPSGRLSRSVRLQAGHGGPCRCSILLKSARLVSQGLHQSYSAFFPMRSLQPQRRLRVTALSPYLEPGFRDIGRQGLKARHQFSLRMSQPFLHAVQQRQFSDCRWSRGFVVPRGFDIRL